MTRILDKAYPSLDYELWNAISPHRIEVDKKMAAQLGKKDRGTSRTSDHWKGTGRVQIDAMGNELPGASLVVDFISLDRIFQDINEQIRLDPTTLYREIQSKITKDPKWAVFFDGATEKDWLNINWPAFGRVVGAAVSNRARSHDRTWPFKGTDALDSLRFWNEFYRADDGVATGDGLPLAKWNGLVEFYNDHGYDPDTEVARSLDHLPSAPFRRCTNTRNNDVMMPNPLSLLFRQQLHAAFSLVTGDEKPEEIQKSHGEIVLEKLLAQQIVRGRKDHASFILFIHGMCAHHIMRGNVAQQKIGLHLVSMLGSRLNQRGVGGLNVPDLADTLDSSYRFGLVLRILRDSKLVDWSFVDHAVVTTEAAALRSRI